MLSSYLYTFNVDHYPVEACIQSCLGFSDEVVVVDFDSWDNTQYILNRISKNEPKVRVYTDRWDSDEPGMDGIAKSIARSKCQNKWVFQIDADEVVPEQYWGRIQDAVSEMELRNLSVAEVGTVNFFLSLDRVCYHPDSGLFKSRLSHKDSYTHGIPIQFRKMNSSGRIYCSSPQSDGTDLLDHSGRRVRADISYADPQWNTVCSRKVRPSEAAEAFQNLIHNTRAIYVYHYGSVDLWTKLWKATDFWMSTWELLYGKPPIILRTDEERRRLVEDHYRSRLEKALPYTFEVDDIVHSQEVYSFYGFSS